MKKAVVITCVALLSVMAQANYCTNGDFNDGTTGWNNWGNGMWMAEAGVLVEGWTDGAVFGQMVTHQAMADTVYTLTARVQSRYEAGGQAEGVTVILQDGSWQDIVRQTFWFSDYGDVAGVDNEWRDYSISFDTALLPDLVGQQIVVAAAVADDGRWDAYGNIYVDSMTLVPEPATLALLGLGALLSLKRRKA